MTIRFSQNKALGNFELFTQAGRLSASSDLPILMDSCFSLATLSIAAFIFSLSKVYIHFKKRGKATL